MIRTTCAWLLLALAASPFTAPFSTCDFQALVGRTAYTLVTSMGQPMRGAADVPANSDACGLSPIVSRVQLTRGAAHPVAAAFVVECDRPEGRGFRLRPQDQSPPDLPLNSRVLRL